LEHEHIVQVAAGGWHCLAVTKSGSIYAWGGNEYFQCGVDAGMLRLQLFSVMPSGAFNMH
jgi:alpha-tubulin suppressor-like RCC1 family protein